MNFGLGLSVGLVVVVVMGMFVMVGVITARQNEICPRCNSGMIKYACSWCGYEVGDKVGNIE